MPNGISAREHFEEDTEGSIENGKLADFVILSDNSLTVPKDRLAELTVLAHQGGRLGLRARRSRS